MLGKEIPDIRGASLYDASDSSAGWLGREWLRTPHTTPQSSLGRLSRPARPFCSI